MKKFSALLLCVVLAVSSLAFMTSCSSKNDGEKQQTDKVTDEANAQQGEKKPAEEQKSTQETEETDENQAQAVEEGADNKADEDTDIASDSYGIDKELLGKWVMSVELASLVPEIANDEELSVYMPGFAELSFELALVFDDDNKARMGIEEESAKKVVDSAAEIFEKGMTDYINYLIEESGNGMTMEDALETLGYSSIQEVVYEFFNKEELMEELGAGLYEFNYYAENGVFYSTATPEEEINAENYEEYTEQTYKISDNTLTLEGDMKFTRA